MRVIVTRPHAEGLKWVDALVLAGYEAVALPLIDVTAAPDVQALQAAWEHITQYDAVMFVSGNAVDHFFAQKPASAPVWNDDGSIKTRAFVTGPGSYAALRRAQVDSACIDMPPRDAGQFDSESLWAVVGSQVQPGWRVLVVRGMGANGGAEQGQGRDWFADRVRGAGGQVDFVVAYQRVLPQWEDATRRHAERASADGSVWLFSSSEAITNLTRLCPQCQWSAAKAVATHPRIAQVARDAGFGRVCESRPSLAELMASIESLQ